jgi:hypothetical protein
MPLGFAVLGNWIKSSLEAVFKTPDLVVSSNLSGTLELPNSRKIRGHISMTC